MVVTRKLVCNTVIIMVEPELDEFFSLSNDSDFRAILDHCWDLPGEGVSRMLQWLDDPLSTSGNSKILMNWGCRIIKEL